MRTELKISFAVIGIIIYSSLIMTYTNMGGNSERVLFLMNWIPIVATIFMAYCYVPQIIQTIKTKKVRDLNLPFWINLNIALTLLLTNSILLFTQNGNFGYVVSYIVNEGCALIMLILILKYRKNDED